MCTQNTQNEIEWSCDEFFDAGSMLPPSRIFLPCSPALFHTILATCSSHTSMSCVLFSCWLIWLGASRRQQLQHWNHILEENYLGMIQGWSARGAILRGWNFVALARGLKLDRSQGGKTMTFSMPMLVIAIDYIYAHAYKSMNIYICIYIYTYRPKLLTFFDSAYAQTIGDVCTWKLGYTLPLPFYIHRLGSYGSCI